MRLFYLLFLLVVIVADASAQSSMQPSALNGKVRKRGTQEILIGVTVANISAGKHNVSDMGGNYKIAAQRGDTILFSSVGYKVDTIVVEPYMFNEEFFVAMTPHATMLEKVTVEEGQNYVRDSIERRDEYRWLLDAKHPVKLMNEKRAADQPGFNFSPLGFFSKREKQKRRLKARLRQEEEDYYIDTKFSYSRVKQLTGLSGDSLRMFMVRYRPTYKYCRVHNSQDMLMYVNERLKEFKLSKVASAGTMRKPEEK